MDFIFECSTRYLTSERSERVRYRVEHEKIKLISTNGHVVFCLLYKHTNNDVFDDFSKISDHFPKISEAFLKLFRRLDERLEHFLNIFRRFPKAAEDFRGGTDDVLIIQHKLRVPFQRLCTHSNGNLKTCDNNLLFSRVKISSYLHV